MNHSSQAYRETTLILVEQCGALVGRRVAAKKFFSLGLASFQAIVSTKEHFYFHCTILENMNRSDCIICQIRYIWPW
jgi:hypothetical protein